MKRMMFALLLCAGAAGMSVAADSDILAEIEALNAEIKQNSAGISPEKLQEYFRRACADAEKYTAEFQKQVGSGAIEGISAEDMKELEAFATATLAGGGIMDISGLAAKLPAGSIERKFVELAANGAFWQDMSITARATPAWYNAQGGVDRAQAQAYLKKWKELSPKLNGVYRSIADNTIKELLKDMKAVK